MDRHCWRFSSIEWMKVIIAQAASTHIMLLNFAAISHLGNQLHWSWNPAARAQGQKSQKFASSWLLLWLSLKMHVFITDFAQKSYRGTMDFPVAYSVVITINVHRALSWLSHVCSLLHFINYVDVQEHFHGCRMQPSSAALRFVRECETLLITQIPPCRMPGIFRTSWTCWHNLSSAHCPQLVIGGNVCT